MNNLTKQHYNATVKRGKIKPETLTLEFIEKMQEELDEIIHEYLHEGNNFASEIIDLMAVCGNLLIHLGFDVENEFKKNIVKQQQRND